MKQFFLLSTLLVLGTTTQGCVIKTTSTGDPSSPSSNTSTASRAADPPPAPAPAPAAAKPAASPSPAPAPGPGKPATAPAPASAKQTDAPARPATPAPAPTARPATPAPAPTASKDTAPPKKPQPIFTAPPKPKAQPAERKADDANGMPPNMKDGAQMAYWIWRDKDGVTWHLRTTAGGPDHRFSGRIWVDGTLADLKPSRLEMQDRLKKEDEGVLVFDFVTNTSMDGFDFKVTAGRCVTFHLLIDGKPAPREVEIGQKEVAAGAATFRLCR